MFLSETHLPQLLPAEDYCSPERFEREMNAIFYRGWHVVGTASDIANAGDYITAQIGAYKIIVRNFGSSIQAFLNVCCHRYCEIASLAKGHTEKFFCQYHGWEFDETGQTRRIPDAPSFKPLEKGSIGLTSVRTEQCGDLIFISLDPEGESLQEFLGPSYAVFERHYSSPYRQVAAFDSINESNWKIAVENGLESYHVDCVHKATFVAAPEASDCEHQLEPTHTTFRTTSCLEGTFGYWLENTVAGTLNKTPTHKYLHHKTYPSFASAETDLLTIYQSILPLEPAKCVVSYRLFMPELPKSALLARAAQRLTRKGTVNYWRTVVQEDLDILPLIQQGVQSPRIPPGGLISMREERLFHFQQYVNDAIESYEQAGEGVPA